MTLFTLLVPFARWPWMALIPALTFVIVARRLRSPFAWIMASLWFAYGLYETVMWFYCHSRECIRIDLLLIVPILVVLTVAVALSSIFTWRRRRAA